MYVMDLHMKAWDDKDMAHTPRKLQVIHALHIVYYLFSTHFLCYCLSAQFVMEHVRLDWKLSFSG